MTASVSGPVVEAFDVAVRRRRARRPCRITAARTSRRRRPARRRRRRSRRSPRTRACREPFRRVAQVDVRRQAAGAGAHRHRVVTGHGVGRRLDDGGHLGGLARLHLVDGCGSNDTSQPDGAVPASFTRRAAPCRCWRRSSAPAARCSTCRTRRGAGRRWRASSFGVPVTSAVSSILPVAPLAADDGDVDRVLALLRRGRRRGRDRHRAVAAGVDRDGLALAWPTARRSPSSPGARSGRT